MLKIYLKVILHEIHSDGVEYKVHHSSFYTIEEEAYAQSYTREYSLYHDELQNVIYYSTAIDYKRGRAVWVHGDDCFLKFKQWKEPDAKLIECVSYRECSCSMRELCTLPADKVIAYLKQEGLNITIPS